MLAASSNLVRWGAVGFMLGGVLSLVASLTAVFLTAALATPVPSPRLVYYYVGLGIGTRLLLCAGLVGLHILQKGSYGYIGRAGFYTILVAVAARFLGNVMPLVGSPVSAGLVSLLGLWGAIVGFALYGAASLRASVLPRWYGVLLIVFVPISEAFPPPYGNMWLGVFLIVLGYGLWSRRGAPAEQSSRVR